MDRQATVAWSTVCLFDALSHAIASALAGVGYTPLLLGALFHVS